MQHGLCWDSRNWKLKGPFVRPWCSCLSSSSIISICISSILVRMQTAFACWQIYDCHVDSIINNTVQLVFILGFINLVQCTYSQTLLVNVCGHKTNSHPFPQPPSSTPSPSPLRFNTKGLMEMNLSTCWMKLTRSSVPALKGMLSTCSDCLDTVTRLGSYFVCVYGSKEINVTSA